MKHFPEGIQFCYPWRTYQQRILNELDYHLQNRHLHLEAPPGSGKTVLGLEVMLRLNEPTIILAPTLTIKNQWENRFTELFLQQEVKPEWISMNIKAPAFVTVTTYQALFSLYRTYEGETKEAVVEEEMGNKEKIEQSEVYQIFDKIREINFRTIVLDEAHHLRTAWWKATMAFKDSLHKPTTVALTATPPYDTTVQEWEKYEQLCGPIDAEIHVAELVRENDLCPHQDYIYLSSPKREEYKQLDKFHHDVDQFIKDFIASEKVTHALKMHPWVKTPTEYTEAIYQDPSYFSSMVIFLHHVGEKVEKEVRKVMGVHREKLPEFNMEWAEILMNHLLNDPFYEDETMLDISTLKHDLKHIGAIERGKVYLQSTPTWDKRLVQSASKFNSIEKIVQLENQIMGDSLRMVILADYIRKEALTNLDGSADFANKLGVVPIFQLLRLNLDDTFPLAILTGSFVVVPKWIEPYLLEEAADRNVAITYDILPQDKLYMSINITQQNRSEIVAMMTTLLSKGHIRIIIGTAALLGEGWDAPCVNTLIMASYVGSFMLSNQMRGRAIRVDPDVPDKTGAIWHLACVDDKQKFGGHDIRSLQRRFKSLVGLNVKEDVIESGLQRMVDVVDFHYTTKKVANLNHKTIELARNRNQLSRRWRNAVMDVDTEQQVQLRVPDEKKIKPYLFRYTVQALLYAALNIFLFYFFKGINAIPGDTEYRYMSKIVLVLFILSLIITLPKLFKVAMLAIRYVSIERFIEDVGKVLYETLYELELVETAPKDVLIEMTKQNGMFIAWIRGGKTQEKNVYLIALHQLLEPIDNPRYILCREPGWKFGIKKKDDYHAVPDEIGKRKEDAELLAQKWTKAFDKATAVYTRSPEGRSILIRSRLESFSSTFLDSSEQISVWK